MPARRSASVLAVTLAIVAGLATSASAAYGWAKTEAGSEWWHVNYVGP